MCTICGDNLVEEPLSSRSTRGNTSNNTTNETMSQITHRQEVMMNILQSQLNSGNGNANANENGNINININNETAAAILNNLTTNGMNELEDVWQTPPAEAMNPQPAPATEPPNNGSKTSHAYLESLSRICVHDNSAILHQAVVTVTVTTHATTKQYIFQATVSEFEPHPPFTLKGELCLSKPIYGSDPMSIVSSASTANKSNDDDDKPIILFMERGINTFIQKSNNASKLSNTNNVNVQGVICSNNNSLWPYTMKDSTGKGGSVPIVMIRQSDGQILHSLLRNQQKDQYQQYPQSRSNQKCTIIQTEIKAIKKSNDQNSCIICTESYNKNEKIIQLPQCNHYFHEKCILHWLKNHNTCPFCRVELPLEDVEDEEERRRRNASAIGIGSGNGGSASEDRSGLDRREQWETIFA